MDPDRSKSYRKIDRQISNEQIACWQCIVRPRPAICSHVSPACYQQRHPHRTQTRTLCSAIWHFRLRNILADHSSRVLFGPCNEWTTYDMAECHGHGLCARQHSINHHPCPMDWWTACFESWKKYNVDDQWIRALNRHEWLSVLIMCFYFGNSKKNTVRKKIQLALIYDIYIFYQLFVHALDNRLRR